MDAIDFARGLLKKLDADIIEIQDMILDGKPSDFAHYRHESGRRNGMLQARRLITESFGSQDRTFIDPTH